MVYNILACVLRPSAQPSSKTFNFQETAKLSSLVILSLKCVLASYQAISPARYMHVTACKTDATKRLFEIRLEAKL